MDKEQLKPIDTNVIIKTTLVFYEEKPKPNTFGSNDITYEVFYGTREGIIEIYEVGAFGDRTLAKRLWDKRGRGITLEEMLEDIEEIANMPLKEFKRILANIPEEKGE